MCFVRTSNQTVAFDLVASDNFLGLASDKTLVAHVPSQ